jgi:hypothetical protein
MPGINNIVKYNRQDKGRVDIMSAREKQAAAKQTFVFLAPLMSKLSA